MGTNYYARKIPTKKRKLELCNYINSSDFDTILKEINKTFGSFNIDYDGDPVGGNIHLGKRSAGWKFLWNPNIYIIHNGHTEYSINIDGSQGIQWVKDPDIYYYVYPLSKEGIWNFLVSDNIEVYDEYGEKQDKEEFFNMAVNWNTWQGKASFDSKSYIEFEKEKNPYYKTYICSGEYVNMLKSKGYKMISEDNSDFYSDGLRFATSTEFG